MTQAISKHLQNLTIGRPWPDYSNSMESAAGAPSTRCCADGRLNVFPADDVAGVRNLHRWLKLRKIPDYKRARRLLSRWYPYEGLLYFHFLLAKLDSLGFFQDLTN